MEDTCDFLRIKKSHKITKNQICKNSLGLNFEYKAVSGSLSFFVAAVLMICWLLRIKIYILIEIKQWTGFSMNRLRLLLKSALNPVLEKAILGKN